MKQHYSDIPTSQFIEMFGDPVKNNNEWATLPIYKIAPETPSSSRTTGNVWVLNLDMIESNTGKILGKTYSDSDTLLSSVAPFDEDNVLFSKLRPYLNKVVIPDEKGYATTELVPLKPNKDRLNKIFFSHLLRGNEFVSYANGIATGTKMPRMPLSDLRNFEVILPPMPLQEQFVTIANQADKSEFDGNKSQFIEMVGNFQTQPLKLFIKESFPGEWGKEALEGTGIKVIRTTNFTNSGKLDLSDVVARYIDPKKVEKKKLCKGDIILERSGGTNENPVGRVVYFNEKGDYLFNNFTQLLRPIENINSLFLFYSLYVYYQQNRSAIRSMGNKTTGIQNLKMEQYWEIPIADCPIEVQSKFADIYQQADKSEYYYLNQN